MTESEMKALKMIEGSGKGLTELGNVIVSRAANALLKAKLIDYAPSRNIGYTLTEAGRALIK